MRNSVKCFSVIKIYNIYTKTIIQSRWWMSFWYCQLMVIVIHHETVTRGVWRLCHGIWDYWQYSSGNLPAHVYLKLRYLVKECDDCGQYNAGEDESQLFLPNIFYANNACNIHTPAIRVKPMTAVPHNHQLTLFAAYVVWCGPHKPLTGQHDTGTMAGQTQQLSILLSAADVMWLAQYIVSVDKMNGWACISGDCHSQFSRAESVLINSWMPTQQTVYDVLRVFMIDWLTDGADNSEAGTLSNYHIKTLILWACELKPINWWSDDDILVSLESVSNSCMLWLFQFSSEIFRVA